MIDNSQMEKQGEKLVKPTGKKGSSKSKKGKNMVKTIKAGESLNLVACKTCEEWHLFENLKSTDTFEEFAKEGPIFNCRLCKMTTKDDEIKELRNQLSTLESKHIALQELVSNIIPEETLAESNVNEKDSTDETINNSQASFAEVVNRRPKPKVKLMTKNECAATISLELTEREKRKKNIILFNTPELGKTKEERREADKKILVEVGEHLGTNPLDSTDFFRLGKIREDGAPRPLLVKLTSEKCKQEILANARKCKGYVMEGLEKQLGISPDRTVMERDEIRKRFRVAQEARANVDNNGQKNQIQQH